MGRVIEFNQAIGEAVDPEDPPVGGQPAFTIPGKNHVGIPQAGVIGAISF